MPDQTKATAAHIYQDGGIYRDVHVEHMYDAFFNNVDISDITLGNLQTYTKIFHGDDHLAPTKGMFENLALAHPFFTQFGHVTLLPVEPEEQVPAFAHGKTHKASIISLGGVHTQYQYADNLVNAGFLAYLQLVRHYVMEQCTNGALDGLSTGNTKH